jgi:hypothetical protein
MSTSPHTQKKNQTSHVFGPEVDPRQKRKSRKPRKSIFLDRIHPQDFLKMNFMYACEQCSHFSSPQSICTIGYRAQHMKEHQLKTYELTGKMALCRFMEID